MMLFGATSVQAFSTGIATTSFPVPAQACNFCHGGGSAPMVTLACVDCGGGTPIVAPLSVHEFTLTVGEVGLQDHAGLNVSAALGSLATGGGASANTQTITGAGGRQEITHTAPKAAAAGTTTFSFLWTAPAAPGSASLVAWGNAVDFNGNTAGDRAQTTTLSIVVSGGGPTATDTPTPGETPTPTPTVPPCPVAVDGACVSGFEKGLLLVKQDVAGHEKLVAKLLKGPALAQTDMGNPLAAAQGGTGTAYALCLYDGAGVLAGALRVDRAGDTCGSTPCWRSIGPAPTDPHGPGSGYKYGDASLAADGVRKLLYKAGSAGRSKAIVIGKGSGLPAGIAAALQSTAQATVQLRSSDGLCLAVTLADVVTQDPSVFKAK